MLPPNAAGPTRRGPVIGCGRPAPVGARPDPSSRRTSVVAQGPCHPRRRVGLVWGQFDHHRTGVRQPGPGLRQHGLYVGQDPASRRSPHAPPARRRARTALRGGGPAIHSRRHRAGLTPPGRLHPATARAVGRASSPARGAREARRRAADAPAPGLARAKASASGLASVPQTDAPGRRGANSVAKERAIAPDPVPASTTVRPAGAPPARFRPAPGRPPVRSSGRGISTRGSHHEIEPAKGPSVRARTATAPLLGGGPSNARAVSTSAGPTWRSATPGGEPSNLFDNEARFVSGAQRGGELGHQLAPCQRASSSSPGQLAPPASLP